jgi:NADH-quinone oxidoreductase subunit N
MRLYVTQLESLLVILAIVTLLSAAFRPLRQGRGPGFVLAGLVGLMLVYSFALQPLDGTFFHGAYRFDPLALYLKRVFLLGTALVLVMSTEFARRLSGAVAEFYALILLSATGMLLVASVNDFILLFVSLELVTISFYVLTSYLRRQLASLEAGAKYLILGALSSGFTAYGIAWLFGATGTTNFDQMRAVLEAGGDAATAPLVLGMVLVLTGLGFKIASVPAQIWAPDVYQGAPTPVTAFLAVGSKAAGFALLLRVLLAGLLPVSAVWAPLVLVLAAATLLYGNLGALPQRNIKRLLGYSSIGHAGYMLMGIAAVNTLGAAAVMFYLAQYAFTTLCAFLAIIAVTNVTGTDDVAGFAGLHRRAPILAAALFIALLSLAGIPPLSGFFAKFFLFAAVIERAADNWHYYALAGVGAVAVVISLYFYLRVGQAIYLQEPATAEPIPVSPVARVSLYVCMIAIIGIGIFQAPLVGAALRAVSVFGLTD